MDDAALASRVLTLLRAETRLWAFTVWVQPGDEAMQRFLSQQGHKLDSSPISMAAPLSVMTLADPGDLDFEETRDLVALARLNDAAFGFPPPAFEAALQQWGPEPGWRGHLARHQGQLAASVMSWESPEGDLGITGVATLPTAQGTGLATRLLSQVLREAHARGLLTTSLQASPRGRPVYARLGYRDLGTLGMWEHRVPAR